MKFQGLANQSGKKTTNTESEQESTFQQSISEGITEFLKDQQPALTVQQVHPKVQQILTHDEIILYIAVQTPLVSVSPDCVILTSKRFIIYRPKLLGGVTFHDYIWRDLQDARLEEGARTATLTMKTVGGMPISVGHLPKNQARRVYSYAQDMEERMRDERRIREMEERRAAAGGVVFHAGATVPSTQASQPLPQEDPVQKLTQLKQMLDADLISQDEYDAKKAEILSKM